MLAEPIALIEAALVFAAEPPPAVPLVGRIFTRADTEDFLARNAAGS